MKNEEGAGTRIEQVLRLVELVRALSDLPLGEMSPDQYHARVKALEVITQAAWNALVEVAAQIEAEGT